MAGNIGVGEGINAVVRGGLAGTRLLNEIDERRYRAEDRGLRRTEIERQHRREDERDSNQREDRQREESARKLAGQLVLMRRGMWDHVDRDFLKQSGISNPEFVASPDGAKFGNAVMDIAAGDREPEEGDIEIFNRFYAPQIKKGIGEMTKSANKAEDGTEIPQGSEIIDKDVIGLYPARGAPALTAQLRVKVRTPDGKEKAYLAPVTEGRDSSPGSKVKYLKVDTVMRDAENALRIADVYGNAETMALLEAKFAELTGQQLPSGTTKRSYEEGSEMVTEFVDASGQVVKSARAPRWQQDKPSSDWSDFQRAKADGFAGTFVDFKQALKGRGLNVTLPDGTVIQQGGAASSGLAKPTVNALEESIVNAQAGLDRLRQVGRDFDPSFLRLQNQLGANVAKWKDKIGAASPEDRKKVEQYETFKSGVLNNLNLYIKEITGAAMSQAEAVRLKAAMPSMEDSPTSFKAKYDRVVESLSRSMARAYYTRQNGLSMDGVPLDQMDRIIDDYGNKLELQIKAQNPNLPQADVERLAMDQVRRAFGM